MLERSGQQAITPAMVQTFARTARERIGIDGGGYRRDHLRALGQRVEVADKEVRIMGSKGDLLRTLAAASGVKSATPGVGSSVLKWRMGCPPDDGHSCRFLMVLMGEPQNRPQIKQAVAICWHPHDRLG
ncbi:hypothetical protein [Rhodopila sp.]|uniref:hypothetical protein n=1 Tax=Rhodopila sp. TaxID=2480087 RepID=UPI003D1364FB